MGGYTLQMRDREGRWKRWYYPAPHPLMGFDAANLAGVSARMSQLMREGWTLICLTYQEPERPAP